jgi:hypothetical protein
MPHSSPTLSSAVGLAIFALFTGAALVGVRVAGTVPQWRAFQRPLVCAAVLFALGDALSGLQLAFPALYGQPYENLGMLGWLTLSSIADLCLLWFARGRMESGGVLVILGSTAFALAVLILPTIPPHPPFFALGFAWCLIVTVFFLPYRLLRRRLPGLYPPHPSNAERSVIPSKQAQRLASLYALSTFLLAAFIYFKERWLLASLPVAFAWAGAALGGYLLLDLLVAQTRAMQARGWFQRWLAPVHDQADTPV